MQTTMLTKQANNTSQSAIIDGAPFEVGSGFTANSYHAHRFNGLMDPLIMVDQYTMTAPTFGAHPHAGLSAVSVLFESSEGNFHNRDSLGNDFDLEPGDLYWLKAGSGVIHDESPRNGATTRGLQVFVNLPNQHRHDTPESLHVRSCSMPIIEAQGYRVRVVLGSSQQMFSAKAPLRPMTILDGRVAHNAAFTHERSVKDSGMLIAIDGDIEFKVGTQKQQLLQGQAAAINPAVSADERGITVSGASSRPTHFVLFCSEPTGERYVQEGPFAMGSEEELRQVQAQFAAGHFGMIPA